MNNSFLPHEPIYTAQPANMKKRYGGLSKIYTYPIDKNVKWYRPFPEYKNVDQDKYFFKYEYIKALERHITNINRDLQLEELQEVFKNEIELNDMKREDRQILQLNNYFKNSLFSSIMVNIRDNYLKTQAEELIKNNSTYQDLQNRKANMYTLDKQTLTLATKNSEIQTEIDEIDKKIVQNFKKIVDDDDFETAEEYKDVLNEYEGGAYRKPLYEKRDEERNNEIMPEVGNLQNSEIDEIFNKIDEETQGDLLDKTKEQIELESLRNIVKDYEAKSQIALEKSRDRLIRIGDRKTKIESIKKANKEFFEKRINDLQKNINKFNDRLLTIHTRIKQKPEDLYNTVMLLYKLELINESEFDIIKNNFPDIKAASKDERQFIQENFVKFFNDISKGIKYDINNFMDAIDIQDALYGLEQIPFEIKYDYNKLDELKKDIKTYQKSSISNIGEQQATEIENAGYDLQDKLEGYLNLDLSTLLPDIPYAEPQTEAGIEAPSATPSMAESLLVLPFEDIGQEFAGES